MANLAIISKARVAPVFLGHCRIRTFLAGAGGILAGQPFYFTPTGVVLPTVASALGQYQMRGMALNDAGKGQAVDGLVEGYTDAIDVSALAYDALVYLSDTAGTFGTIAGTNSVVAGRVVPVSDRDPATGAPSKLLYIQSEMTRTW